VSIVEAHHVGERRDHACPVTPYDGLHQFDHLATMARWARR
jgi:hypothetical protein